MPHSFGFFKHSVAFPIAGKEIFSDEKRCSYDITIPCFTTQLALLGAFPSLSHNAGSIVRLLVQLGLWEEENGVLWP